MEATAKLNVAFAGTTVVALGDISAGSAGASKAEDEAKEKLSFFLKNSSLLLAFLLKGLSASLPGRLLHFFPGVQGKEEGEVNLEGEALHWVGSAWQKVMHHCEAKVDSTALAIFNCSSEPITQVIIT